MYSEGWECSSAIKPLPSTCKALSSSPNTAKSNQLTRQTGIGKNAVSNGGKTRWTQFKLKERTLDLSPEIDSTSIPHFISLARRQCGLESNIEGKTRRITDRKRLGQRFTLMQIDEYGWRWGCLATAGAHQQSYWIVIGFVCVSWAGCTWGQSWCHQWMSDLIKALWIFSPHEYLLTYIFSVHEYLEPKCHIYLMFTESLLF